MEFDQFSKTAILVFANSPEEEAKLKRFSPGSIRKSRQIAKLLFSRSLKVARQSQLPVFLVQPSEQQGNSFQERLANAMESIWQKGYQKQLIIGSDTPGLSAEVLQKAAHQLKRNDWLIGPAKDGGAYVIGLDRNAYQRESFLALPWQTADLFCQLAWHFSHFSMAGFCLPSMIDIDSHADLHGLLKSKIVLESFIRKIQSIVLVQPRNNSFVPTFVERHLLKSFKLRGPPFC